MEHWDLVDNDLYSVYGIDTWEEEIMLGKTWPWLRHRILGLMAIESRISNWARHRAKSN